MATLVLAYPALAPTDLEWIQAIRARHDPHYHIVDPHFTLVFPIQDLDETAVVEHVRLIVRGVTGIPFVLRCALPMPDVLSPNAHTFLVPDEGFSAITKLHDRLYTSLLAPYRRPEIPFIPHITVGQAPHAAECQQLATTLNEQEFEIHGSIERLTVVRYAGGQVTTVVDLPLAGRGVGQV